MLSVVIPIYNEEAILWDSVNTVHTYLNNRSIEHEVILADNGSTDRSAEIARTLAETHSWISTFSIPERSVGGAFCTAVRHARYDRIVTLDADLSSDLLFLEFAASLLEHCDMLVGSKSMGRQRRSPVRVLGSQTYLLCAQLLFGISLSDFSLGAKAYRKSAIEPYLSQLDSWTGYVFELALHLSKSGKRVLQIGVDCEDSRESRFNLLHEGWYRFYHLFKTWKKFRNAST